MLEGYLMGHCKCTRVYQHSP